jgi:hypothetical protein
MQDKLILPDPIVEIWICFDMTDLCAINEAGKVISNEQSVHLNTPGWMIGAREFERVVCVEDNHRIGANNKGVVAGVAGSC